MHQAAFDYVSECVRQLRFINFPLNKVVEFGGQDVNESNLGLLVRDLVKDAQYLSVDIYPGRGVDVVCDAADWRTDEKYDLVICCETLEHTPRGKEIIESAHEALRPGGILLLTCATDPRAVHGAATDMPLPGEYYQNVSPDDMKNWLLDWGDYNMEVHPQGDLYVSALKRI